VQGMVVFTYVVDFKKKIILNFMYKTIRKIKITPKVQGVTILIPIKMIHPLLMPLKQVLKTNNKFVITLLMILQYHILISFNNKDNSLICLSMSIISSRWVSFEIYLYISSISISLTFLFQVRTSMSSLT
jgi:hypothetical protein